MLQRAQFVSWLAVLALAGCADTPADPAEDRSSAIDSELRPRDTSRIREIEDHRLIHDPDLGRLLASRSPSTAAAALIAVGRIGDVTYADRVTAALGAPQAEVRRAAAFAAGLLGGATLRADVTARIAVERDDTVIDELCLALGRIGDLGTLAILAPLLDRAHDRDVQAAAAEALGALGRNRRDLVVDAATLARLVALAGGDHDHLAEAAAFALANLPGPGTQFSEAQVIGAIRAEPAAAAREHLYKVLGRIGSRRAVDTLAAAAAHEARPPLRARAVLALGTVNLVTAPALAPAVIDAFVAATRDSSSQVVVAAARGLALKSSFAHAALPRLIARFQATSSSWIRTELLPALVAIDATAARPLVDASVRATALSLREAAIAELAGYATDADVATLSRLAGDPNLRVAAAAINALSALTADRISPATKQAIRAWIPTRDPSLFFAVVTAAANFGWTDFLAPVSATYATWTRPTEMDGRLGVLTLIEALGTTADLAIVEQALNDSEKPVVEFAAEVFEVLTGTDVSDRIPLASRVTADTPDDREVARALSRRVRIQTPRGVIKLRMRREAPLTATNFVQLVEDGFYDGIEFHRVEPAFVIQGGDPAGSGFGGSDALIREEVSSIKHRRGTVGIATAGKDTGSSQFFVNDGSDIHLDGRFTVFAEVIDGMDVVDRIEVGDRMISARTY